MDQEPWLTGRPDPPNARRFPAWRVLARMSGYKDGEAADEALLAP
jgi:hypothetical protein